MNGSRGQESAPILAQMTVPTSGTLFCFTAAMDASETARDPSARSDFHWQTFKCRLLLFSAPVLACPVRIPGGHFRHLTVVCRREDVQEDEIHPVDQDGGATAPEPRVPLVRARLATLRLSMTELRPVCDGDYSACLEYTLVARLGPLWNPVDDILVHGKNFLSDGKLSDAVRLQVNVRGLSGVAFLGVTCSRVRVAPLDCSHVDVSAAALDRLRADPLATVPATCIGKPWVHVLPSLKRGMVMAVSRGVPHDCPFPRYKDLRRHWKNMYGYRLPEEPGDMLFASVYFQLMGKAMCYPFPCLTPCRPTQLRPMDAKAVAVAFLGDVATRMATVCGVPSPVAIDGLSTTVAVLQAAAEGGDDGQPNLRPLAENTASASPPRPEESGALTCPLSMATQRDGSRPTVEWNFSKAPKETADKENIAPEVQGAGAPSAALHRPVFRAAKPVGTPVRPPRPAGMLWFQPSGTSTPTRSAAARSPTTPRSTPSSVPPSSVAAPSCRAPAAPAGGPVADTTSASGSSAVTLVAPTFRVPASKPIFLSRLSVPARAGAKQAGRASPASPRVRAAPAGASPGRKPAGTKRPSSEPMPVPDLRSADACRRATAPLLLAWLRERGVPCRSKDKKAELVEKAVAALAGEGQ